MDTGLHTLPDYLWEMLTLKEKCKNYVRRSSLLRLAHMSKNQAFVFIIWSHWRPRGSCYYYWRQVCITVYRASFSVGVMSGLSAFLHSKNAKKGCMSNIVSTKVCVIISSRIVTDVYAYLLLWNCHYLQLTVYCDKAGSICTVTQNCLLGNFY